MQFEGGRDLVEVLLTHPVGPPEAWRGHGDEQFEEVQARAQQRGLLGADRLTGGIGQGQVDLAVAGLVVVEALHRDHRPDHGRGGGV